MDDWQVRDPCISKESLDYYIFLLKISWIKCLVCLNLPLSYVNNHGPSPWSLTYYKHQPTGDLRDVKPFNTGV